jgi:hypothetical protein
MFPVINDAQIADVDFRITQLSPEGITRAEYLEKLQVLWDEKEAYQNMEDVADDWKFEPERDGNGNIVTYAGKWKVADFAVRREMLKDAKLHAAKNGRVVSTSLLKPLTRSGIPISV